MTVTLLSVPNPIDATVESTSGHFSWEPEVIGLSNGGYMVAWTEYNPNSEFGDEDVNAKVYDALGNVVRSQFRLSAASANGQYSPELASLSNGNVIAVWSEYGTTNSHINGQFLKASGSKVGTEFSIVSSAGDQYDPSVTALQGGGFVVTWQTGVENTETFEFKYGIDAQVYNATGGKVGGVIHVAGLNTNPKAEAIVQALSNGGFAIAWTEDNFTTFVEKALLKVYSGSGNQVGPQITLGSVGDEDSTVGLTAVGDRLVATWSAETTTDNFNVRGQIFSNTGSKIGSSFGVNSTTSGQEENPSVVANSDGFVVTWEHGSPDGSDSEASNIYGQRFDRDGHRLGKQFAISPDADEYDPDIATLRDGGLVTVWDSDNSGQIEARMAPAWVVEVDRHNLTGAHTGEADIIFLYNGVEVYRTTAGHFDDASVVKADAYGAIVRTNAGKNHTSTRIELIDQYTGAYTNEVQTAVQIHGGTSTQNSEGCMVLPVDILNDLLNTYIIPSLGVPSATNITSLVKGYPAVMPLTVVIKDVEGGPILQPKLALGANVTVSEGHSASVAFDLVQAGPPGDAAISKVLRVTLQVSGNAQYGSDWTFGTTQFQSYDEDSNTWVAKTFAQCFDETTGTLEFYVKKLLPVPHISVVALGDAGADNGETINFTLTDVNVYLLKGTAPILYDESIEGGSGKIDDLFMPSDNVVRVTISDPAAGAQTPVSLHEVTADSPHWFQPVELLAQDLLALA